MNCNFINLQIINSVLLLELDDPSANTLTLDMLKEMEHILFSVMANNAIEGLIIVGKGDKFFSGGVNISMLLNADNAHNSHFILYAADVLELFHRLTIPIVTIINGNITGGGLELALIAHYRIAKDDHYNIGFPEVKLGVIPGMGGTQRLARLIGAQRALEMITQGTFCSPTHCKEMGLVDELLPADYFRENALDKAISYINPSETAAPITFEKLDYSELSNAKLVTTTHQSGIAVVRFRKGLEVFSLTETLLEFNEHLQSIRADGDIHALLIVIEAATIGTTNHAEHHFNELLSEIIFRKISGYSKITAVCINRYLTPIEFNLALHCDFRYCVDFRNWVDVENDKNTVQEIDIENTIIHRYRHLLDPKNKQATIESLLDTGFYKNVNDPIAELTHYTPPFAAAKAIGYAKLAISQGYDQPLSASLLLERHLQEQLFVSNDSTEGMKAYAEKRQPHFKGV